MQRRITWLVAAISATIVAAFTIPLLITVRSLSQTYATQKEIDHAHDFAVLVSSMESHQSRQAAVSLYDTQIHEVTWLEPDGHFMGRALSGPGEAAAARARISDSPFIQEEGGEPAVYVSLQTDHGTYVLRHVVAPDFASSEVTALWSTIVVVGLVLIVGAMLIANVIGRKVATPVTDVAAVAHRLRTGELDARATPSGPSDTRQLAEALNQLADRIGYLTQSERERVADMAHRLRSPITALRLDADQIPDTEVESRIQGHVQWLQHSLDRVIAEARNRIRSDIHSATTASAIVRARAAFWAPLAEDQGRTLSVDVHEVSGHIGVNESDLIEIVDILIDNVFAHTPEGTALRIAMTPGPDGTVVLQVVDSGPGLNGEATQRGTSTSGSSGLGLDIVRRIVADGGGSFEVASSPSGTGFVATAVLPTARDLVHT